MHVVRVDCESNEGWHEQIHDKANPNWPKDTLADVMKKHLSTTTNEVVARLNKDWDADVRAFDEVVFNFQRGDPEQRRRIARHFPNSGRP